MTQSTVANRWDPVYDAEGLTREIARLAIGFQREDFAFFDLTMGGGPYCQGDIVELGQPVPCIDEDGVAAAREAPSPFWMLVGNSCDHHRSLTEVEWTQAVPLEARPRASAAPSIIREMSEYKHARKFLVPTWPGSAHANNIYVADFLRMVSVHRGALKETMLHARMSEAAWYLLHACIIRFLARGDGRMD